MRYRGKVLGKWDPLGEKGSRAWAERQKTLKKIFYSNIVHTQCYISFKSNTVTQQVYTLRRAHHKWSSRLSPDRIITIPLTYPCTPMTYPFQPHGLFIPPLQAPTSLSPSPILPKL